MTDAQWRRLAFWLAIATMVVWGLLHELDRRPEGIVIRDERGRVVR